MAFFQVITLVGLVSLVSADVNEIVGQNQYLPPSKGYNYDRPSVPFPSSPASRPTPSYQPPQSSYQPPSQRPTYQPPTPSYQPPAPSYGPPTPTRPPAPRPTVGYPTGPSGYQPGTAPSGTQGQIIGAGSSGDHDHSHDHHEPGMPYDFEYKVKDDYYGTDYSRNEVSDGDVIRGEYRVQLPDGRLQIVKYTADWKNGFNADVSYQGEPNYPTGSASAPYPASGQPSNSYGPPPPTNSGY